jgi:hypothetical protein
MCCATRYKRLLSAWNSSYCQKFAFGVKAVERAGGRILVFIHIFWISDHHLGRGATLENQPALKTKRGIVPRNCVYEDQGRTGGGWCSFRKFCAVWVVWFVDDRRAVAGDERPPHPASMKRKQSFSFFAAAHSGSRVAAEDPHRSVIIRGTDELIEPFVELGE